MPTLAEKLVRAMALVNESDEYLHLGDPVSEAHDDLARIEHEHRKHIFELLKIVAMLDQQEQLADQYERLGDILDKLVDILEQLKNPWN